MINELTSLILERRKRRPRKRNMKFPTGAELRYRRYLRNLLRDRTVRLNRWVRENLQDFLDRSRSQLRVDAPVEIELSSELAFLRAELNQLEAQGILASLYEEIDRRNQSEVQKQIKAFSDFAPEISLTAIDQRFALFSKNNLELIESLLTTLADQTEQLILEAVVQNTNTRQLARQISRTRQVSQRRANRIAMDQVGKAFADMTRARSRRLGLNSYRWNAINDARTRPAHRARDGETYSWDHQHSDGHPGQPINCRCVAEPVFPDE